MIKKRSDFAFGKEVYLLGSDSDGTTYWLEAPSWDCGWYWGFGYIETYTNNTYPSSSLDIVSHQHATDFYSEWCRKILKEKTFSDDEKWELCELFMNFYTLKNLAETQKHEGKEGNYTGKRNGFDYRKLLRADVDINRDCLPFVMAKIVSILSGKNADELEEEYKKKMK
jgi:hypothetical protein